MLSGNGVMAGFLPCFLSSTRPATHGPGAALRRYPGCGTLSTCLSPPSAEKGKDMDLDDLMPQHSQPKPRDLRGLSIGELEEYIARMEAEIIRVRETIRAKQDVRAGAEALFKR